MMRSLRASENFHILLWLLKDLCWVMDLRIMGMIMIVPTLAMAVWIAWRSRTDRGEFLHCLAVVFWIAANGTWMIGEFFYNDGTRPIAIGFFAAGLLTIVPYYLVKLVIKETVTK
ncbi:MAG: hypothetical protein IPG92_09200 [Flavobacteriales bacterium]|nr:hypothetical protein [Flavobacteriales bacterium]MBP7409735.1 hypothetical protein [Flavobacteriales bacterium]